MSYLPKRNKVDAIHRYKYGPNRTNYNPYQFNINANANANTSAVSPMSLYANSQPNSPCESNSKVSSLSVRDNKAEGVIVDNGFERFDNVIEDDDSDSSFEELDKDVEEEIEKDDNNFFTNDSNPLDKELQKPSILQFEEKTLKALDDSLGSLMINNVNMLHFFHNQPISLFLYKCLFKNRKFSELKSAKTYIEYHSEQKRQKLNQLSMPLNQGQYRDKLLSAFHTRITSEFKEKYQIAINWFTLQGFYSYIVKTNQNKFIQRVLIITLCEDTKRVLRLELADALDDGSDYKVFKKEDNAHGNRGREIEQMFQFVIKDIKTNAYAETNQELKY